MGDKTVIIVTIVLVLSPLIWFGGGILAKLFWSFFPAPVAFGLSGYAIWRLGLEWIWLIGLGIGVGIVGCWLWQRTRIYLVVDRWIEKLFMFGG